MPPRPTSWRPLLPGIAVALAVFALAFGIALFMRPGTLHGRTFRLFVTTNDATGVMKGTEVWLAGRKVGRVVSLGYMPPSAPAESRVLLEAEILQRHHAAIRKDSRVEVRSGSTLIGAPVVQISSGTPRAPAVAEGDTVTARNRADVEGLASRAAVGARELPAVMKNVQLVNRELRAARGTLGPITANGVPGLGEAQARAGAIMGSVTSGRGTLGLLMNGRGALMTRASVAMARADSVRALLASGRGSVGRFRRDSTLMREVAAIRDELSIVNHLMSRPTGTVGRLRQDQAIQQGVAAAQREMAALFADLKQHPFRYINIF